ncbi:hypothetical protein [Sphaerisporangium sp. NPDC051011]|uniref:hypothetical protein n=1 Tax=Sphaerisporangium sp. NPDC051011 TaxID=3155792 RepID=UPI0033CA51BA
MILSRVQGALTQERLGITNQAALAAPGDVAGQHDESPPGDRVHLCRRNVPGPRRPLISVVDQLGGTGTGTLDPRQIARACVRQSTTRGDQRLYGGGSLGCGLPGSGSELERVTVPAERCGVIAHQRHDAGGQAAVSGGVSVTQTEVIPALRETVLGGLLSHPAGCLGELGKRGAQAPPRLGVVRAAAHDPRNRGELAGHEISRGAPVLLVELLGAGHHAINDGQERRRNLRGGSPSRRNGDGGVQPLPGRVSQRRAAQGQKRASRQHARPRSQELQQSRVIPRYVEVLYPPELGTTVSDCGRPYLVVRHRVPDGLSEQVHHDVRDGGMRHLAAQPLVGRLLVDTALPRRLFENGVDSPGKSLGAPSNLVEQPPERQVGRCRRIPSGASAGHATGLPAGGSTGKLTLNVRRDLRRGTETHQAHQAHQLNGQPHRPHHGTLYRDHGPWPIV